MEIKKFNKKFLTDEDFRKKAIIKLSDALKELGVDESILSENIDDINNLNPNLDINEMGKDSLVFIHKSDSDKNSTSIVVGMAGMEELENVRLLKEFKEFKAFKAMKLKDK